VSISHTVEVQALYSLESRCSACFSHGTPLFILILIVEYDHFPLQVFTIRDK